MIKGLVVCIVLLVTVNVYMIGDFETKQNKKSAAARAHKSSGGGEARRRRRYIISK